MQQRKINKIRRNLPYDIHIIKPDYLHDLRIKEEIFMVAKTNAG